MDLRSRHPKCKSASHPLKVCPLDVCLGLSLIGIPSNTAERKPVTNSRDTQELLPEAGQEMLRIFYTYPAKASLLQDFGYYEVRPLDVTCLPTLNHEKAASRTKDAGSANDRVWQRIGRFNTPVPVPDPATSTGDLLHGEHGKSSRVV